jgi:hypothetical protein
VWGEKRDCSGIQASSDGDLIWIEAVEMQALVFVTVG